jgi:hypothetical protein
MDLGNPRIAYALASLMAAALSLIALESRADDAPVSESPQTARLSSRWQATLANAADQDERPPEFQAPPPASPYAAELTVAYVASPFLGVASTIGGMAVTHSDFSLGTFAFGVVAASIVAPGIHLLNGEPGLAARSFVAFPLVFTGSVVLFALGSLAFYGATLEPSEEDGTAHVGAALATALIGGLLGAAGWAIFDILDTSDRTSRKSSALRSRVTALRVGIAPRPDGIAAVVGGRF